MVNWKDPREMETEALAFTKVVYVLSGLYIWEIIITFYFELSIIRGKRSAAWPLVLPFFLCRYGMLWAFIGLIISFNVSTKALYTFISVAGNTTIASASTSLMIRTIALWEWKKWVILVIGALSLGQWGILIRGMTIVKAVWNDTTGSCAVNYTNHFLLNLNYFYTMAFDLVILLFTTVALGRHFRHSSLSGLLFRDGLVYFLITSTCNTIPAVLNLLDLNGNIDILFV
ncbi:hypothetical protein HYDPIDRAFT_121965 [Hydnomerulius pinastri MD-312]|nr:hypothetical protein HYDPIDRAFT_121965 [Hydnomerulius pinastri MD-312]